MPITTSLGQVLRRRRPTLFSLGEGARLHLVVAVLLLGLSAAPLHATQLKQAQISQVIKDVKLLPPQAAPRPASARDEVRDGTAVRTGVESRAELTFTDQTLARLGANTIFSFNEGTRNLDLGGGAMLLRVPKNAGGAQINTAAVTAAITGTTVMLEYHPDAFIKFIILEGTGRIFRRGQVGESVLLHAGQMLIVNPNGKGLPDPVDVDLDRLMKTSLLINGFPPLPSDDLIAREISTQLAQKTAGGLVETNLVIFGRGTIVSLLDPTHTNVLDQANANETRLSESPSPTPTVTPTPPATPTPPVTPTPAPSKFGRPIVITTPDPYVIGSNTTIATDPTITTNGQTDFGKIYRGPALDGPASVYFFGSTSAFDTQIKVDRAFSNAESHLPLAVFKFTGLELTGNPTILTANGGTKNLALISVGDITSGPPGGTITFSGLDLLFLATQNGSITLTADLAFQNIAELDIYARGAGSTLTFDSAVSGTTNSNFFSEGNILLNNALGLAETNVSGSQLNFSLKAGGDLTASKGLTITLDNSRGGDLSDTAEARLFTGGNMTLNGGNGLSLTIANNDGGHIGGPAALSVLAGGDFTASAIDLLINDRNGGTITGGASLFLNVGGALTTTGDATSVISTRNDGKGGGTIGSDVFVTLNAASVSIGGFLDLAASANGGGNIPGATILVNVPSNLVAQGGAFFLIQSSGFNVFGGPFIGGGTIGGNATIILNVGNVTTGDLLDLEIENNAAGNIGGNASMTLFATGSINSQADAFFDIINTADLDGTTLLPGGTIGGEATILVNVNGTIDVQGNGEFAVLNNDRRFLAGGGTIGGNGIVALSAASISTGGFFQPLVNNTNGMIGGIAAVVVDVTGDISVGTNTFFNILNSAGVIGGDALGGFAAANFSSGSTFEFQIVNDAGGSIGGDASLEAALSGNLTSPSNAFIQILNGTGTIGRDALIDVTAASVTVNNLFAQIDNTGGAIGGKATINTNVLGSAAVTSDATIRILGSDGAAAAAININGGSYDAGGTFLALIDGNGAITFNNASVHADVLKVGALGANGVLNIGGGTLSADTTLKLYAPGSNGTIDFVANVTLDSGNSVIIAANTVTINNGVMVTITGDDGVEASVFTNIPNYTGSGGNGSTSGIFGGNGATTQPLDQVPPFGPSDATATGSTTSAGTTAPIPTTNPGLPGDYSSRAEAIIPRGKRHLAIARVADSNALLDLADRVTSTAHGRSNMPTGTTSRGPGSVLSGKGRPLPSVPDVATADLTLSRPEGRRTPSLP